MRQRGKMAYVPLYFKDFKEGCEDLSNDLVGAYLRVLFEIYEAMGPIEFDDRKLGKRLGCRPHKARDIVNTLICEGKLFLTSTGQISNHRAEDEILKFVSISVQNSLNAKSNPVRSNSTGKKPSKYKQAEQRPLSDRAANIEYKIENLSSSEVYALPPRDLPAAERSKRALEEFHKRKRQRQGRPVH